MRRLAFVLPLVLAFAGCGPARRPDGGVGLVQPPTSAPAFSALDQDGKTRTLGEFTYPRPAAGGAGEVRGKPVVLFFYPKDGTPGCTKEACAFRDAWSRIQERGAAVVGISRDSVDRHRVFAQAHKLPFPLLSDESGAICAAYGVSSTLGMASRVTFVLDRAGNLFRTFPDVDPALHVDEVLAALDALPK